MTKQDIWNSAQHVWQRAREELQQLEQTIDQKAFNTVVHVLGDCKGRILTAGVGTSGAAAKKIAHSLCCIERPAVYLSPGDGAHGGLGVAQPGDVAILFSKGGNTREVVNLLHALQEKDVFIIGITENENSVLAKESNLLLQVKIEKEADTFNMLATTSTMMVVAVFDAICITLMKYTGYTKEQFALIHPGGAVGERLLGKSNDKSG